MKRLALVLVALAGFACAPVKGAAPACPIPTGQEIAAAVNVDRAANGVPGVNWDAGLAAVATDWAHQATEQKPHRSGWAWPDRYASVRENVWGAHLALCIDAGYVQAVFMGSGDHRPNVLLSDADAIGVGVVVRGDRVWIVQNFGVLR